MEPEHSSSPYSGMDLSRRALGSPLTRGEVGVLMARAGVGKTACLTHIALEHILRNQPVLHVCIDEIPDKVKVWYQEFLKSLRGGSKGGDPAELLHRIETLRFIVAYLHGTFTPERLEQSLNNLKEQTGFNPEVILVDGLDFDSATRSVMEALNALAVRRDIAIWVSARTHRHVTEANEHGIPYPCNTMDDLFQVIMQLDPTPEVIRVKVLKHADQYLPESPPTFLDPTTYLVVSGRRED